MASTAPGDASLPPIAAAADSGPRSPPSDEPPSASSAAVVVSEAAAATASAGERRVRRGSTFSKLQRAVQRHRERMNSSEVSISSLVLKRKALTKKFVLFVDEAK